MVESEKVKNNEFKDSFLPFEINLSKFRIRAFVDTNQENFLQRHEARAGGHQVRKHVPAHDGYTFWKTSLAPGPALVLVLWVLRVLVV